MLPCPPCTLHATCYLCSCIIHDLLSCRIMATCPSATGTIQCTSLGTDALLTDSEDAASCSNTAIALNAALAEYRGPGSSNGDFTCTMGTYLVGTSADSCAAQATTLNSMMQAYTDGSFRECSITTPTTSATTSPTTSHTSCRWTGCTLRMRCHRTRGYERTRAARGPRADWGGAPSKRTHGSSSHCHSSRRSSKRPPL